MKKFCLIVPVALLLAGCAAQFMDTTFKIYDAGEMPPRPYQEIKTLYDVTWADHQANAQNYFVKTAQNLNADAVIFLMRDEGHFKMIPFGPMGMEYRYRAIAIKWTDAGTNQPAK